MEKDFIFHKLTFMETFDGIIERLDLKPHPEGGYYNETYKSVGMINEENLKGNFSGSRHFSTCIYYLLVKGTFSAFHRIRQDEIWHFYKGTGIELHMIFQNGEYSRISIGNNFERGEVPQFVVPAGAWFAAGLSEGGNYSLAGCTVSPGFDFRDFELGIRRDLVKQFPEHKEIIRDFTRN